MEENSMIKSKLAIVAVSALATASIVNCSRLKANNGAPASAVSPLTTEALDDTDTTARLLALRIQQRSEIVSDLNAFAAQRSDECSAEQVDALKAGSTVSTPSGPQETRSHFSGVIDDQMELGAIKMVVNSLETQLRSADKFCALTIMADVSDHYLNLLTGHPMSVMQDEEALSLFNKAEAITNTLKPLFTTIQTRIQIEEQASQAAEDMEQAFANYSRVRAHATGLVSSVLEKVALIRSGVLCEEACSAVEEFYLQTATAAEGSAQQAQGILDNPQYDRQGVDDQQLSAKANVMRDLIRDMNGHMGALDAVVEMVQ
jgi:hypothetical protein